MKINLLVELNYDEKIMHGDDPESIKWFRDVILNGTKGILLLHSNEIGETVGKVKVLKVCESLKQVWL